ncbi:MAG: GxxExxY protein, partial [Sphingobacteriales bacterium]
MNAQELNRIGTSIVDAALTVHRHLGPGLLESAYQYCMKDEIEYRGHQVSAEVPLILNYKGKNKGKVYEIDLLVDGLVVVETKSVERMTPLGPAQLLTHLRIGKYHLGYLINFNVPLIKDGIK